MKKVYLLATLSLAFLNVTSQTFQWAKSEGKYAYDYGYSIATDVNGNVLVAGKYEEFAVFSGTTLPNAGNHDMYLASYAPSGTLNWIRTGGGTLGDYAHCMTTDKNNYIYVGGEIEGNSVITFPGSTITLTGTGDNDAFVCKYDLSGNLLWARSGGGYKDKSEKILAIAYDWAGNVFVAGYFTDTTNFNGTQFNGYGDHDIFVAKYDLNGNFKWLRSAGSPKRDEVKGMMVDKNGDVFICGMMSNNCKFGNQTKTTYNNTNYFDAFIAKYSTDGDLQWVSNSGGDYDDVAWGMTIDNQGAIYTTGEFNAYAQFGTTGLTTKGNADIYVAAYNSFGAIMWAKGGGGALIDRSRGIGTDGTNLFITGQFGSKAAAPADFGGKMITAADSSDIFIAALDNAGNFMWATAVGGTVDVYEPLGYESGNHVCAEPNGNVYATGSLLDNGTFGGNSVSAYGRTDAFVTKLTWSPGTIGINENSYNNNITVYPNPGKGTYYLDLPVNLQKDISATVYNCVGQVVNKVAAQDAQNIRLDLSTCNEGVYIVELRSQGVIVTTQKLILQH